jgi:hypothetical protein
VSAKDPCGGRGSARNLLGVMGERGFVAEVKEGRVVHEVCDP